MDVAKLQKMNNLAVNLQRHNITVDKEQAIREASRLYGNEYNFGSDTTNQPQQSEVERDIRKLTFALRDAIMEIKELKSEVTKLKKELNDVRVGQLPPRQIFQEPVRQVVQNNPQQVQKTAPQQPQTTLANNQPQGERKITTPVDRNGIAPSDVSIDKFFYFGQKKN